MEIFTKSNGLFSNNLFKILYTEDENLLFSPLSINYALTTVSFGTNGNSLKELRAALNQPDDESAIISSYKSFTDCIKFDTEKALSQMKKDRKFFKEMSGNSSAESSEEEVDSVVPNCLIATKMFVGHQFDLKQDFVKEINSLLDSGFENVDFANNPEKSRIAINQFVESKTNNLIKDLFGEGSITRDTYSIIVNALYFKGAWKEVFNEKNTEKKPFYGFKETYEVDMMRKMDMDCYYGEDKDLNIQILVLPYEHVQYADDSYSFMIILPKKKDGLKEVMNKIFSNLKSDGTPNFVKLFNKVRDGRAHVSIPKFKFSQSHSLVSILQQLGINEIFTPEANFDRMTDSDIKVSDVVHKTYVSVHEKGTEAAAATGIRMMLCSLRHYTHIPEFIADHPFVYIINQKNSDVPLFIGTFMHPE